MVTLQEKMGERNLAVGPPYSSLLGRSPMAKPLEFLTSSKIDETRDLYWLMTGVQNLYLIFSPLVDDNSCPIASTQSVYQGHAAAEVIAGTKVDFLPLGDPSMLLLLFQK